MNDPKKFTHEDILIHRYINEQKQEPSENKWFTHRVIHSLPPSQETKIISRIILSCVTCVAVILCCLALWYISSNILVSRENNLTGELLCIYIAIMSTTVLVALQVIQLIKTYF